MYSKQAASLLSEQFWAAFGGYMSPILSAEGEKINWVNYKTGEKDIRFVMAADNKAAKISIVLSHPDTALQQLYFEIFVQLRKALHELVGEDWHWRLHSEDQHRKRISEIYTELGNVNVLLKTDWPLIISFLKPRLIALDKFWCEYKYAFERSGL